MRGTEFLGRVDFVWKFLILSFVRFPFQMISQCVDIWWNPITPFCFCTLQRTSQLHWGEANIPNLPLNIGTSSSNLSNSGKHKLSFLHSWIRREATRCLSWISCLWIQMEERTSASGRTQYNTQTWGQPAVGPCLIPSPPNCVTFVN